jgi:glutamate/tyrosine decarboxylase-like PLP-dependent enzyme
VGTGATDDLVAIADFCATEQLWFHVDGAFGALARLSPRLAPQVEGLARADSVAFDLHKWGWVPYDCGVALVRDADAHRAAFTVTPAYLSPLRGGTAPGTLRFSEYGVQLSRSFRALKAWMTVRAHGVDALARILEQNVDQAAFLAARVTAEPELELMAPAPLNVVCFRYAATETPDALNRELLVRLQESGLAVPSHTVLGGRFALRVAITTHRSRREDFTLLVDAVLRLGRELAARGAVA